MKPTEHKDTTQDPISVSSVQIRNFRLLSDVNINLSTRAENFVYEGTLDPKADQQSDPVTVLIGHNNSGKTTLAEALISFLNVQSPKFGLQDFSSQCHKKFYEAWRVYQTDIQADEERDRESLVREVLPEISLRLDITYDADIPSFGPLSELIIDLEPTCTSAIVQFSYGLQRGRIAEFFDNIINESSGNQDLTMEDFLNTISPRIPKLFERRITAIDPTNRQNIKTDIPIERMRRLITVDFLQAQRGLDDEKDRPKDPLGQVFQSLFEAASQATDDESQKKVADQLQKAVQSVESELGKEMSSMMTSLSPALEEFGYPGLSSSVIQATTTLDISSLLRNYTSISYPGASGVSLPESYSGLGSRNLILILFRLLAYYRLYMNRGATPGIHLVFIEEPEAHLHPQMQEVFIEQLSNIKSIFSEIHSREEDNKLTSFWSPQFIVSTHSSHIANRARFSTIRYFRVLNPQHKSERCTVVRDLSTATDLDAGFLHQYLTLTASNLFFADKAILVEGASERLLIPAMMKKEVPDLMKQYVSILEVGGYYADKFYPLLDFLAIPTLVITDLDSNNNKGEKTEVHKGVKTSNTAIREWFGDKHITPKKLLDYGPTEKIKGNRRIAFQIPETGMQACGRSFEDAFVLANPQIFDLELSKDDTTGAAEDVTSNEEAAKKKAKGMHKTKSAIEFAIERQDWVTPKYILEGLKWLEDCSGATALRLATKRKSEGTDVES